MESENSPAYPASPLCCSIRRLAAASVIAARWLMTAASKSRPSSKSSRGTSSPAGRSLRAVLRLDCISKIYHVGTFGGKELRAVNDVSFEVGKGEVVSLIGESGSGKSTIGKMILRLISTSSGAITFDGMDISSLNRGELKHYYRRVQGVFQDQFSGGQLQRLLIARALLLDIQFLVADEIISMLDASTRIDVLNLLADLKSRGLSILFITHDLSLAHYIRSPRAAWAAVPGISCASPRAPA